MRKLTALNLEQLSLSISLLWLSSTLNADDLLPVSVVTPTVSASTYEIRLTGNIIPKQQADLSARVEGLVATLNVDIGDKVDANDTLLTLDPTLEQQLLEQKQASMAAAKANFDEAARLVREAEQLVAKNHLPQTELDLRSATKKTSAALYQVAQAELKAQQTRLRWHRVSAPFAGVIAEKYTESGEWVTPGTPVLRLVSQQSVYLDVLVPQESFSQLEFANQVSIKPDSEPGNAISGEIHSIVPVSDPESRTFRVRLIAKEDGQLLPGTSATAVFKISHNTTQALHIPRDALLLSPDGSYSIFVVPEEQKQRIAKRKKVVPGVPTNGSVQIIEGLEPTENVVIRGNEILQHGQAVTITVKP